MADWDITQLAELKHNATSSTYNSLVQIDDTHFILAYTDLYLDGFLKTFSVNLTTGAWTEIDVLEHDTENGTYNSLVQIDATKYAVAYTGSGSDGYIKTFSIDANADNITVIDALEFDTSNGIYNSMALIDSTHLILSYQGLSTNARMQTFSIDANADNITKINTNDYVSGPPINGSLVKIDSTHYAIAFTDGSNSGILATLSLDGSYATALIDLVEQDATAGTWNALAVVDSTHLILAYRNSTSGSIKTFFIDENYDNITEIDTLADAQLNSYNYIVKISNTHYLVASADASTDGWVTIFSIDANADNITQVSELEHDGTQGHYNSAVYDDSIVFLAYSGSGVGYVKSFFIEGTAEVTLPTRNSWNRFYADRGLRHRCYWRIF